MISASQAGIAILALTLGLLIELRKINEIFFLLVLLLIAVLDDIIWAADWAVIPTIVKKEDIASANGYSSAIGNGHVTAGLSLLILVIIKKTERNQGTGFIEGFKYALKNNPSLLYLSVIISIPAFFSSLSALGITDLFAVISREWYSISYSLYYVGPIISGIIFGKYFPYRGVVRTILTTLIVSGILFIVLAFLLKTPLLASLLFLVVGFFFSSYVILYST